MKYLIAIFALLLALSFAGCEDAAKALSTTISGTVTDNDSTVSGALIMVLAYGDTLTAGITLSNGSITNSAGRYTVIEVDPGDYYVCAIRDLNGNLSLDPGIDEIGYYGDTLLGITVPAKVTLHNEEEDLENINILEMYTLPGGK